MSNEPVARVDAAAADGDERMRKHVGLPDLDPAAYDFSVATNVFEYQHALSLVHRAYVDKGYEPDDIMPLHLVPHHLLRECVLVVVRHEEQLVGTVTIFGDTPVGLPLDNSYPKELEELRQQGARLAEAGSLAVAPECRRTGINTLLGLIGQAVARQIFGATHLLSGVNPTAQRFYRAVFNFRVLGSIKQHHDLTAPLIGLIQETAHQHDFLREHFRTPHCSGVPVHEVLSARILDFVKMPDALRRDGPKGWAAASTMCAKLARLLVRPSHADQVVIKHALAQAAEALHNAAVAP